MTEQRARIAGEAFDALADALRLMKINPGPDGMVHVELRADDATTAPFVRALLRVEAALMLADADGLTSENFDALRTGPQRSADALVELARRMGERIERQPDP